MHVTITISKFKYQNTTLNIFHSSIKIPSPKQLLCWCITQFNWSSKWSDIFNSNFRYGVTDVNPLHSAAWSRFKERLSLLYNKMVFNFEFLRLSLSNSSFLSFLLIELFPFYSPFLLHLLNPLGSLESQHISASNSDKPQSVTFAHNLWTLSSFRTKWP